MNKKTSDIERAIHYKFDSRSDVIIKNISWGFDIHECDLLCISKSGYLTEIEIKVSAGDLKKDAGKGHGHRSNKIKYLYFAIPSFLGKYIHHIPERAGIIVVNSKGNTFFLKHPVPNKLAKKLTDTDRTRLYRNGALKYWDMYFDLKYCQNNYHLIRKELEALKGEDSARP